VRFNDSQLERCYETNLIGAGPSPDELRQVGALLAVHETFQMFEGDHSARVHETIDVLLLPELRPGLRRWYQRANGNLDPAALSFREHLSRLAGEQLEAMEDIPHNPT
jgi:hypothetical protein